MKLVYEMNNVHLYFHPKHKVLHLKWHREDCRGTYLEVLKALKRYTIELEAEGWLIDLSECKIVQSDIIKDNIEYVANALTESKLKRYARVSSQDPVYEVNIKERVAQINKTYNLGLTMGSFDTEAEALAWLFDASEGTLMED